MNHPKNLRLPKMILIQNCAVISGVGRGKKIGVPTINLDPMCAEGRIPDGVYAGIATFGSERYDASIHCGPRPVFNDSRSLEVHILKGFQEEAPKEIDLEIVARIRDVSSFATQEDLIQRISEDIAITRAILNA